MRVGEIVMDIVEEILALQLLVVSLSVHLRISLTF
jgi:hypothetical protein